MYIFVEANCRMSILVERLFYYFFFFNLLNINHKPTFGTKDSLVNDSLPWFFQREEVLKSSIYRLDYKLLNNNWENS